MDVEHLLSRDSVVCNARARSKKHALDILSQLLAEAAAGIRAGEIFEILVGRERLGCTALGEAVAIPHGRTAGIEDNVGAFLKLQEPIDFDAPDGEPVDLIFGLLMPERCGDANLAELRELAAKLANPELQRQLRRARDPESLYDLLTGMDKSRSEAIAKPLRQPG